MARICSRHAVGMLLLEIDDGHETSMSAVLRAVGITTSAFVSRAPSKLQMATASLLGTTSRRLGCFDGWTIASERPAQGSTAGGLFR